MVKSTYELASRLRTGGATGGWIIEEFTALMRAVSKIALHRRSNLGMLLEVNGKYKNLKAHYHCTHHLF